MSQYIPKDERIITIEDNAELRILDVPNLVSLEAECKCGGHRRSYDPAADQVGASNETGQDYCRRGTSSAEAIDMLQALYVLYNNYIYNVYKDGKYRLEEGHRNDMNIKYRLLCKRLIEERKRVGVIQYYNVLFIMELVSDKDIWALEQWMNGINNIYMKDIHNWCRIHFVKYHTVFVYRKEYPVKANIWNGYSYTRWRMERMMNLG